MNYGAIILAAGKGTRFKGKKQDILFHGKELWKFSYDAVLEVVSKTNIVVVGKDFEGGNTRSESVKIGLNKLSKDIDRVIILDAARPLVTVEQVKCLLESSYPSITFVRPLVNTVIHRSGEYVNRDEMYELLVPQAFDYNLLRDAYSSNNYIDLTDETRVMFEHYSIPPKFVETTNNLYKVTYPEDIFVLEVIYENLLRGMYEK